MGRVPTSVDADRALPVPDQYILLALTSYLFSQPTPALPEVLLGERFTYLITDEAPRGLLALPAFAVVFQMNSSAHLVIGRHEPRFVHWLQKNATVRPILYVSDVDAVLMKRQLTALFFAKEEHKHQFVTVITGLMTLYRHLDHYAFRELEAALPEWLADLEALSLSRKEIIAIFSPLIDAAQEKYQKPPLDSRADLEKLGSYAELSAYLREHLIPDDYSNRVGDVHPIVYRVLNEVKYHYADNLSLKGLADKYHVNAMYLGRLFHREMKMPFSDYLNLYRIGIAKTLLSNSNDLIADIAFEVGYHYQNYFSHIFQLHEGVTPSEYRKQHKLT